MHPTFELALFVGLGSGLAAALTLLGVIVRRLQSAPFAEAARLVEELAGLQRQLESSIARMEALQASWDTRKQTAELKLVDERSRPIRRVDNGDGGAVAGPTLIAIPNMSAPQSARPAKASAELGQRFGAIWELADAGIAAEGIARKTGQPIGQVELILNLRRQMTGAGGLSSPGSRT